LLYAAAQTECSGILILLDPEDTCPRQEAFDLATQIHELHLIFPVAIVFAHREYEAWFLARLATLSGKCDLEDQLVYDENVEQRRGVKEWLSTHMKKQPYPKRYKETLHQEALTKHIDINLAITRSRSFQRLVHAIQELIEMAETTQMGYVTPHMPAK
jgi:hypothetical protein